MKGHVSYERAPLCGIYIQALISHLKSSHSYHILIQLLLNIFTILKWIIAYYPMYIGYLHSEPTWFTTVVSEPGFVTPVDFNDISEVILQENKKAMQRIQKEFDEVIKDKSE
jgi:hypothetical protein